MRNVMMDNAIKYKKEDEKNTDCKIKYEKAKS